MLDIRPLVLARMPLRDRADWPAATSWFGGEPRLKSGRWPRMAKNDVAPHFLAQIDMAEVSRLRPEAQLPDKGSLTFWLDIDGDRGGVLFVPDHMAYPAVAPPDDTPPLYGYAHAHHFPGASSIEAAPRVFRRWPMKLVPIDLPPGLDPRKAEKQAYEAIRDLGVTEHGFWLRSVAEMLPHGTSPFLWHSALLFLGSLRRSLDGMPATRERKARLIDESLATRAKIEAGSLPPEARELKLRLEDESIARQRRNLALLEDSAPAFVSYVQDVTAWVGDKAATDRMSAQDVAQLQEHFRAAKGQYEGWYNGYRGAEEVATDTFRWLLVNAPDLLPEPVLDHVDRFNLLPAQDRYHVMFGPPDRIQTAAYDNADKVLLAQFHSDSMLDWMWGDVGALQFWIPPSALQRGEWSKATMTMEGH